MTGGVLAPPPPPGIGWLGARTLRRPIAGGGGGGRAVGETGCLGEGKAEPGQGHGWPGAVAGPAFVRRLPAG